MVPSANHLRRYRSRLVEALFQRHDGRGCTPTGVAARLGIRATILLRIDWLSCLIGALLW